MNKRTWLTYLFIVILSCFNAQNRKLDSLQKVFNSAQHDTTRLRSLMDIGFGFQSIDPDTALQIHYRAKLLAEKLKDDVKTGEVNTLIGMDHAAGGKYDEALPFYETAIGIAEKSLVYETDSSRLFRFKKMKSSAMCNKATVFFVKGDLHKAYDLYSAALKIDEEIGNKKGQAVNLGNIGIVYFNQANYSKGLEYYFRALRADEQLQNKNGIARHLGNIGGIYYYEGKFPEALKYYLQALKMNEELDNKRTQCANLLNIGSVYKQMASQIIEKRKSKSDSGYYSKALEYYMRVLKLTEALGDVRTKAANLGNLGSIYMDLGNLYLAQCNCKDDKGAYRTSLEYFFESCKISEQIGDKNTLTVNMGNIGMLYQAQKDLPKAELYFNKSFAIATEIGSQDDIRQGHKYLSDLFEMTKQPEKALKHYKLFVLYRDSINNAENVKKQTQTEMQYGFSKKQEADSIRNVETAMRENLKHEQEIKQQRLYTTGGIIGFGLMVLIAGISLRAYTQKRKANHLISEQKALVEEKQKEILDSIHYAKRIQESLMPSERFLEKKIKELKK